MTANDMSNEFILRYTGGIITNLPYNDREISSFLTQASIELVQEYFTPDKNRRQKGFEQDSITRAELAGLVSATTLLKPDNFIAGTINNGALPRPDLDNETTGPEVLPHPDGMIQGEDNFGVFAQLPKEALYVITERAYVSDISRNIHRSNIEVQPMTYDAYHVLIDNPYKNPYHSLIWRLDWGNYTTSTGSNTSVNGMSGDKPSYAGSYVPGGGPTVNKVTFSKDANPIIHYLIPGKDMLIWGYTVHYIKKPEPIVVDRKSPGNQVNSQLAENLHPKIVERAISIASAAAVVGPSKYQISTAEEATNP